MKLYKKMPLTKQQGRPRSALVHPEPQAQCPDGISSLQGVPHSCWSVHKAESFALENRNNTMSFSYSINQAKGSITRFHTSEQEIPKDDFFYLLHFRWGPRRARTEMTPPSLKTQSPISLWPLKVSPFPLFPFLVPQARTMHTLSLPLSAPSLSRMSPKI